MRTTLLFGLAGLALVVLDCGPPTIVGTAKVQGSVSNVSVASPNAQSIVRTLPPNGEIMIAPNDLACGYVGRSDHLTIDLGGVGVRTFTIVKGYPFRSSLAFDEARVHACPAQRTNQPCDEQVLGGTVDVTRYDADAAGGVEGTFDVKFVDGEISGSFSAPRCD